MSTMKRLPEAAIKECLVELRAACRLPIEDAALEMVVDWLRPNFERILGHPEGGKRWADHGHRMRDNARYLGTFADFFGNRTGSVGAEELKRALEVVRADCTVRAEATPVAYEYCRPLPLDTTEAERFIKAVAPMPEPV
jgi:hypothetical protein